MGKMVMFLGSSRGVGTLARCVLSRPIKNTKITERTKTWSAPAHENAVRPHGFLVRPFAPETTSNRDVARRRLGMRP